MAVQMIKVVAKSSIFSAVLAMAGVTVSSCGGDGRESGTEQVPQASDNAQQSLTHQPNVHASELEADVKGNGGDVVTCFASQEVRDQVRQRLLDNRYAPAPVNPFESTEVRNAVESLRMLDLYEYTLPTGIPPVRPTLLDVNERFDVALPKVLDRLALKSKFAEKLRETLAWMPLSSWRSAPGVVEIDDSDHAILLPGKCLLIQIAVRQDASVFYDEWLFSRLGEQDRLALVLHELTYKIARDNNLGNSRSAREAVGIIMAGSQWDQISPWQLHRRLLPLGAYGFTYSAGGRTFDVKKVHKESAAGVPVELELAAQTNINIGGIDFLIVPRPGQVSLFLRADGSVAGLAGAKQVSGPVLPEGDAERIVFDGDRVSTMTLNRGRFRWDGDLFWNVYHVDFDRQGAISMVSVGSQSSSGGIMTVYGPMMVYGAVHFYPGTRVPIEADVYCHTALRTALGTMYACGQMKFHPNGAVASIERMSDSTSSGDDRFVLPSGISLRVGEAKLTFYDDGSLATYKRRNTVPSGATGADIIWSRGSFDDVVSAKFGPGNQLESVTLSFLGHVIHDEQAAEPGKKVGAVTLDIDSDGRIITPF